MVKSPDKVKYSSARLMSVQAVYFQSLTGEDWDKVASRFLMGEIGGSALIETSNGEEKIMLQPADAPLFTRILRVMKEQGEMVQEVLVSALSDPKLFDQMEPTLKSILKAGIAEFYANANLDAPIILSEYVEITRSFYSGGETKMVNALLDKIAKVVRG
ncbi:MAG: hypothetical protein LBU87_04290 [Lactobacillales bacterium]|jgi:N utilization substance protein B|nr:hypothetical protein [Lactobacillales bacterium]